VKRFPLNRNIDFMRSKVREPLEKGHIKIIAENRKARHDYFIDDQMEAGMVLVGTEVKALREGKANLKDSYARIKNDEVFVHQLHISPYSHAYYDNHDPMRPRKLLLHRTEIKKLANKINEKGYTLVPLKMYFRDGRAKLTIGLARGKRQYDKRDSIKSREAKRDLDRVRKDHGRK
jgi:SsrA-binding protein